MTDDGRDSGDDAPDNDLADDNLPDPEDVIASSTDDTAQLGQDLPSTADIIDVHERIVEEYDLTHTGTRTAAPQLTLRENVLERADQYDGVFSRAAGLFRHTVTEHVFEDENKRTAWIILRAAGHRPRSR
jgi:hypothetical protein